ncbi:hypothetical protein [Aestuariivirga sp.]|uniref:hypothetical protein n=1 Tax=Aestuariivirga sp. TaxID=2650926 RepID=UPI003593A3B0
MAKAPTKHGEDGGLKEALREARLAEAAHFDAALDLRDSKSLRLQLLKDDLAPVVQSSAEARGLFDLTLVPGEPPRLWIDLISYVLMEPDHRTYRFMQDRQDERDIVFESADRRAMTVEIRRHMAHRLVNRERQAAAVRLDPPSSGYSSGSLILAWTSGFAFGALVLLGVAIYLGFITA